MEARLKEEQSRLKASVPKADVLLYYEKIWNSTDEADTAQQLREPPQPAYSSWSLWWESAIP